MTSTRERQQRAAARARLAREMAQRQAATKKRRQRTIIASAAGALLLVVAGTVWAVAALTGDEPAADPPAALPTGDPAQDPAATEPGECAWLPEDPTRQGYENLTEVGTPLPGEPREGISTVTMETNRGTIAIELDNALVPCTAASFAHLAEQEFYDGSACHRLVTEDIYVLQCGDPTGTSGGGPTYRYAEENLPVGLSPAYPAGVVAMAKTQEPSSTGSQFFIVYQDTDLPPEYTLVGAVTEGLDIVEQIAAAGHDGAFESGPGGGHPNEEIIIETLRVSDPA